MDFINGLKSVDIAEVDRVLENFIISNIQSFSFPTLNDCNLQTEIWNSLIILLENPSRCKSHPKCLETLKILSRDKQFLDNIINPQVIQVLVASSRLNPNSPADLTLQYKAIQESQKCIFNLIFNHLKSRNLFLESSLLSDILFRLSSEDFLTIPHGVVLFDLKILFLTTALNASCRSSVRYELKGIHHLVTILEHYLSNGVDDMTNNAAELCCETLKIIFNLLLTTEKPIDISEDDERQLDSHLMTIIRQLLSVKSSSLIKKEELKSHAINLLTSLGSNCYHELAPVSDSESESFNGHDMSTVSILLDYMDKHLDKPSAVIKEGLMPILSVLIEYSSNVRTIRKFLRSQVLPPLRDVSHRPEEGNELRNKLCRLMTCTVTQVEFLVAEFLFVLCKENVRRLIKYTGYGNAAGLLAHRGLMMGSPAQEPTGYSDSSDDSETEEYKQVEDNVNPVTGSYEPPRPNPLELMTDEQKEYEAIKLVNMIDNLQRRGIIQPARIGEDGKPHAVEHILQLQED